MTRFKIVEASIADHKLALSTGEVSSVDLVICYLLRIAKHDICSGLNAFTVFNPNVFEEAAASDARRDQGLPPRPLEGIPYAIKDSYKVADLSVTDGSPALAGLMSNEDSAIAAKLRAAGAILIGKTNMPPMAAGGMQRGLYGRAESPYNPKYLTAAFSSGSSNGAATSLAASMVAFSMGSETVSSGRSPASNNALVCYTPSKGVLSCRGLWPLYVTCDVPVPYARSMDDMLTILDVIATEDEDTKGDFIREQKCVEIPKPSVLEYHALKDKDGLRGKRIGVPKMYVGERDLDPHAKHPYVSPVVITLWQETERKLEGLGAEIIHTDFPLVTRYENDSVSGEANNVEGCPANWNQLERGILIAKAWNAFLVDNNDPNIKCLADIKDPAMLFPKPSDYLPDTFLEVRNWIDYAGLPALLDSVKETSIHDIEGMSQALQALETQRKRDLEEWMDEHNLDMLAFPAQGDVGLADLESNLGSTKHSLANGVKYSNGNRAIRHLGVPTVSVPMGIVGDKNMPVNITFAGKAYHDHELLAYAWAFEHATQHRIPPPINPLDTDTPPLILRQGDSRAFPSAPIYLTISVETFPTLRPNTWAMAVWGSVSWRGVDIELFCDGESINREWAEGQHWRFDFEYTPQRPEVLGWDLRPLAPRKAMIVVIVRSEQEGKVRGTRLVWVDCSGGRSG